MSAPDQARQRRQRAGHLGRRCLQQRVEPDRKRRPPRRSRRAWQPGRADRRGRAPARQRPRHVGPRPAAPRAVCCAALRRSQKAHRVQARVDRGGVRQRRRPAARPAAARRRRSWCGRWRRAASRAARRASVRVDLQIGPRRRIDRHASRPRARGAAATAAAACRPGCARCRDAGRGGGELGAARARRSRPGSRRRNKPSSRRSALAPSTRRAASGVTRRASAPDRRKLGIGIERFGDDDLARIEARDLGRRDPPRSLSATLNAPVEISIAGEREAARRRSPSRARRRRRADSWRGLASSRVSSVIVPGVTRRTTSRRTTDLAPRFWPRPDPRSARRRRRGGRARSAGCRYSSARCDRHAAHGDVVAPDACRAWSARCRARGGDLGVLEEQLVEIAHPVEQQAIGIGGLDLDVLRHHRRRPAGAVARRGVCAEGGRRGRLHAHASRTKQDSPPMSRGAVQADALSFNNASKTSIRSASFAGLSQRIRFDARKAQAMPDLCRVDQLNTNRTPPRDRGLCRANIRPRARARPLDRVIADEWSSRRNSSSVSPNRPCRPAPAPAFASCSRQTPNV